LEPTGLQRPEEQVVSVLLLKRVNDVEGWKVLGGAVMVRVLGVRGEEMEIELLFDARRARGMVKVLLLAGRVWDMDV
jgi:hypothetical protein